MTRFACAPCRPGQDRVPPVPREHGDLPEGVRHHRALFWAGRGGPPAGAPG